MKIRVYYEDTDCGNVVYYANYLRYMERSRTEFLRERGVDLRAYHDQGILFAVVDAHIRYHRSARYDDLLEVTSTIVRMTGATIVFSTTITLENGTECVTGEVTLASIRPDGKPGRIPAEVVRALRNARESDTPYPYRLSQRTP